MTVRELREMLGRAGDDVPIIIEDVAGELDLWLDDIHYESRGPRLVIQIGAICRMCGPEDEEEDQCGPGDGEG